MQKIWNKIFDEIHVVSLPQQVERREYVEQHLAENGIYSFHWHDAIDADHPSVRDAYTDELVQPFPPCFRCGKTECGRDNCNNVLLPSQVAVFFTYLDLYRKLASRNVRALVLEDDVHLHFTWSTVLPELVQKVRAGEIPFTAKEPCLLRLGWALSEDHEQFDAVRIDDTERMSNPCFAITSAFARRAVAAYSQVNTTADIFLHRDLAKHGQAFTVFPPIASELSWSTGALPSLIHPKSNRVDYLQSQKRFDEAADEQARIDRHTGHKFHRSFLITGHPRTGTGYIASLLGQLGFDVGHERAGVDGISSWMFGADAERNPYALDKVAEKRADLHWDFLLHVVRDPASAIPSIMRENRWAPPSYEFRRTQILKQTGFDLDTCSSELEKAVFSLVHWSRMILEMEPDQVLRLEDAHKTLRRFLIQNRLLADTDTTALETTPVNANKLYKGVRHPLPEVTKQDWRSLSAKARDELKWYCNTYAYSVP